MGLTISILVKQQAAMTEHISFHRDPKEYIWEKIILESRMALSTTGNRAL